MSIINKVAEDALRENMLRAQMSNASYNAINGKRQTTRDFREGILNMGKLSDQMNVPKDQITKEMIMDYKREQEERSFSGTVTKTRKVPKLDSAGKVELNAAGVPIFIDEEYQVEIPLAFQQTGMNPELKEYKPLYTGDDADETKAQDIYNRFVNYKIKLQDDYAKIIKIRDDKNKELMEMELKAGLFSIPASVSLPILNKLKNDLKSLEYDRKQKIVEILGIDRNIDRQEEVLEQVKQNVASNSLEYVRTEKENKEYIKEYGDKFNFLNRNKTGVDKQPNETDEQYFTRIKDLERTAFDPNIYKDKAIIEENRKFKKNLQELLKDPAKIENINKSFTKPEDIYTINNNWTKIFNFLKNKYGVNNRFITEKEYIDEIKEAVKNIQSSTFNVSQITKNKPRPTNDTLILTNPANQKLFIKLYNNNVYFSSTSMYNSYKKATLGEIPIIVTGFDSDLIPGKDNYIKIFGKDKTLNKIYKTLNEKINVSSVDPSTLTGAPPTTGSGIKRGRGMQQIQEEEQTEEIPKVSDFGNKKILLNKLYYRNVLSIKDKKGHSIEKLPNTVVSDDFVKIIMLLSDKKKPSIEAMTIRDNLEDSEKELLSLLLFITGINKNKNIDISKVNNVNKLKDRLKLVEAQIVAGNNNPEVKKEMKELVNKLYLYGAISYNHAKDYLKQF